MTENDRVSAFEPGEPCQRERWRGTVRICQGLQTVVHIRNMKVLQLNLASVTVAVVALSLLLTKGFCAVDPALLLPQWVPQNSLMYVPDPELACMGQGNMVPGASVSAWIMNTSAQPIRLQSVTWNGKKVQELAATPPYLIVWWRLNPGIVPPNVMGEIGLRFRTRLEEPGLLELVFSNGETMSLEVRPVPPAFRIQTLAVTPERRRVYLYIEKEASSSEMPVSILQDGRPVDGRVDWLAPGFTGNLRVAMVTMRKPLIEGEWHTWTVKGETGASTQASATIRVMSNPVAFGISGTLDFQQIAAAGLTAAHSFRFPDMSQLNAAKAYGVQLHAQAAPAEVTQAHQAHPSMMGYNIYDEPDCKDDAVGSSEGRPWGLRVGMSAPEMISLVQDVAAKAPRIPVFMTLNMTFMPGNYYTYGAIPDIMTPDFYPITHARSVADIRLAAKHARRATAPRPFGFIYQCNWEEWSVDISAAPYNGWAGRDDIHREGWEFFRDRERIRGFGRPPSGKEVELQIAYLLGEGVKNFWGYGYPSECCQGLLFHGAVDLPEVWTAVANMARMLSLVKDEVQLSHPISWAQGRPAKVRVSTLLCGRDHALVVVINESFQSVREGFSSDPVQAPLFAFPDLPWLRVQKVERLTAGGFLQCQNKRNANIVYWQIPVLDTMAIFRVSGTSASQK